MEAKPFAVGVRIEHRQADCDAAQYRQYAGHPGLPASTYKLSCHLPGGRAAYSFCVCPGGEVVAAASEAERVVTNGMSEFARDKENINGGLLVNVTPEDYRRGGRSPGGHRLPAEAGGGSLRPGGRGLPGPGPAGGGLPGRAPLHRAPAESRPATAPASPGRTCAECLPPFVADTIAEALPLLGQKLRGYDDPDAVLTAVESRSSSPVRIPRDETYQSSLRGLYPCGEGAGYAGGILSAAADGMRCCRTTLSIHSKGGLIIHEPQYLHLSGIPHGSPQGPDPGDRPAGRASPPISSTWTSLRRPRPASSTARCCTPIPLTCCAPLPLR